MGWSRVQMSLPREQHRALVRAAGERSVSLSQIVREAVTAYLGTSPSPSPSSPDDPRNDPHRHDRP